jgi:hypothetical protein
MIVDAHRVAYEVHLREIDDFQIYKQVLSKLEVVFRSPLFIADKMGDLSL